MSDEKKEKNPGRVAAGKRLAEVNKEKKKQVLQKEASPEQTKEKSFFQQHHDIIILIIAIGGLSVAVLSFYKEHVTTPTETIPKPTKTLLHAME